ncbi:MAG: TRAP transporter substrate-binding protein [Polaromonas sp.]|jgi:tripartite ATP-independent transporter DctP family solute receptor|uniref:TRAP transporter substrate-binding protein n=1 Tax=Polaromonas sp. TaxID=1869339 RepID=UPI00272F035A|nr:TRAP transporter substrate-binding protein [Polaromonas sp.]MDP2257324.1 TRAP transporter substrate-binding protein [Polaromonas sp.]MDP3709508.1 TRAP transporter substrate-binding protein [Polaromonas sp.]
MNITRRYLLAGASALAVPFGSAFAQKAEFTVKYGNNLPVTHPMNIRAAEMAAKIKEESKGRLDFQVYPNNQLGNDTDMLSQVRSGALDFFTLSPLILGTLVPAAQISGVGFAFKDYTQVWAAMDGDLGAHVRKQIAGSSSLFAFEKIWDNGYRQMTSSIRAINTPEDLKGMKIRIPPSPFWVSMFKAFEAAPATINFAEVYSSLQTKVVDAQENPLAIIATAKLNEVQKYCSMTNHMWDGFWFLGNKKSFERLPADLQAIVTRNVNAAGLNQRADVKTLNDNLQADLKGKGMIFNNAEAEPFRAKLRASGFYADWHKKFGDEAWAVLEKYTGKLA